MSRALDLTEKVNSAVPRRFRLWEKKRGDRRTGSQLVGTAGEAVFFGGLFLFGSIALAALLTPRPLTADGDAWTVWIWLVGIVLASLIFIGAGGFIYTLAAGGNDGRTTKRAGQTSDEHRSAGRNAAVAAVLSHGPARRESDEQSRDQAGVSPADYPLAQLEVVHGRTVFAALERDGLGA